jgi:hypothetical protein
MAAACGGPCRRQAHHAGDAAVRTLLRHCLSSARIATGFLRAHHRHQRTGHDHQHRRMVCTQLVDGLQPVAEMGWSRGVLVLIDDRDRVEAGSHSP